MISNFYKKIKQKEIEQFIFLTKLYNSINIFYNKIYMYMYICICNNKILSKNIIRKMFYNFYINYF